MIKRISVVALAMLLGFEVATAQNEQIVYIDGVKYTVYTVAKGDTLYSLSKRYNITIEELAAANPALIEGLKAGSNIKIPHKSETKDKSKKRAKKPKRLFRSYTVSQGDTMYSIARLFEVSVSALIADNADIDPAHIKVGDVIYIRRDQIGTVNEQQNREHIEQQQKAMNSVTTDQYSYHVVHQGETAASIAERFDTTVKKLLALNGFDNKESIREGLIIKVPKTNVDSTKPTQPAESGATGQSQSDVNRDQTPIETEVESRGDVRFRVLDPDSRAEVALMLPLAIGERANQNYVDFYQGFLLAADSLRLEGYESHIHLYNTAHDIDKVDQIISSEELKNVNLIVGPVYEDTLIPVARYGEKHSIPVVSPLAALSQSSGSNIFQMSPRVESKFDKVNNLFDGSYRIVVITSETTDKDFDAEVKQLLGQSQYTTHHYIYEHPSVIEKRAKALAEGQQAEPSPSDLSPLLDSAEQTLFVILAGTEVETDRILAALASANISLASRSIKAAPYKVFGNNKWNRYKNIDRSLFFSNNVVMLSTYHNDRNNDNIRKFSANYVQAFGVMPSLYSYRGYDAAMIFIRSLYGKIGSELNNERFTPLQTPYKFVQDEQSRVRVNSEWIRVNYNRNFTITAE